MGIEELLDVPPLRIVEGEAIHFVPIRRGQKGPEIVLTRPLSRSLCELKSRFGAVGHLVRKLRGGEADPATCELFGRDGTQLLLQGASVLHGNQEVEGCLKLNVIEQLRRKMFQISQHEDFAGLRSEYLGHESQQFDRSRARRLG